MSPQERTAPEAERSGPWADRASSPKCLAIGLGATAVGSFAAVFWALRVAGTRMSECDVGVNGSANSFGLLSLAPLLLLVVVIVPAATFPMFVSWGFQLARRGPAGPWIGVAVTAGAMLVEIWCLAAMSGAITYDALIPDDYPNPTARADC